VEGYSTIFREVDEQLDSRPDLVVLPVGVGGLAQAAVTHYKKSSEKRPLVATVEPEKASCLQDSLKVNLRVTIKPEETMLKHLSYERVSEAAWEVLEEGVDISTTVQDNDVLKAIDEIKELGIDVGLCGGAVVAALKCLRGSGEKEMIGLDETSVVVLVVTDSPGD
jgi:diaminopropionate ammonia-lyase